MERTATFRAMTASRASVEPSTAPLSAETALESEIRELAAQVTAFSRDASLLGVERLRQSFGRVEAAVRAARAASTRTSTRSTQHAKSLERAVDALEEKLAAAATAFRVATEKRAVAVVKRYERRVAVLGAAAADYCDTRVQTTRRRVRGEDGAQDALRIERTVAELDGAFARVAGLVHDHGLSIRDIEADVDDTMDNSESTQRSLMELLRFEAGNRALVVKLLAAVTVVGTIIVRAWT